MVFSFDILGAACPHVSSSFTTATVTLLTGIVNLGSVGYRCFHRLAYRTIFLGNGGERQSGEWKDRQEAAENHHPPAEE